MKKDAGKLEKIIQGKIPEGTILPEHTENEHWYRYTPLDLKLPSVTTITSILQAPHLKRWAATMAVDYIEEHISMIKPGEMIPVELRKASILAHEDVFEDAGHIGTQGHGIIERYLKDWIKTGHHESDITSYIEKDSDYRLHAITRSAQKFFKNYHAIPVASEMKVAYIPKKNPESGYAGTLDALMYLAFPIEKGDSNCSHEIAIIGENWSDIRCIKCGAHWQYEFTLVDFKTSNTIWKDEYFMQTAAYWKALSQMTGLRPKRIVIVRLDKAQEKYELLEVLKPSIAFAAFKNFKKGYDFLKRSGTEKSLAIEGKETININDL